MKLPNLLIAYAIKLKSVPLPRNLALVNFGEMLIVFLFQDKSAIPLLFNASEVLPSASNKAKLFHENFSKNSDLDGTGISLPAFPFRTNLKLYNISITPKLVERVENQP